MSMDTPTSTLQLDSRGLPDPRSRRSRVPFAPKLLAAASALVLLCCVAPIAQAETLPDGRTFESVTPLFKAGNLALPAFVSDDGDSYIYQAYGTSGDATSDSTYAPYGAERAATGWLTTPLFAAAARVRGLALVDASANLQSLIEQGVDRATGIVNPYYLDRAGSLASLTPAGGESALIPFVSYVGAAKNLSRVFWNQTVGASLESGGHLLVSDDPTSGVSLIENYGVGTASPRYRLVGLDNSGSEAGEHLISHCATFLGHGGSDIGVPVGSTFNAVSPTASTVFFTAARCFDFSKSPATAEPGVDELFARVDAKTAVPISEPTIGYCSTADFSAEPIPAECAPATFQGASEDGSKVYFTTTQPETGAADTTNNLYLAEIGSSGCPPGVSACLTKMIRVSAGAAEAGVEGVTRISADGSRVYFVATGVLTAVPNGQGQSAQAGAENLYGYDVASETTKFVAQLSASDSGLWSAGDLGRPAQTTPDGRFLAFDSAAQITPDDIDSTVDAYRYDFATGDLLRLSTGQGGYDSNGNNDAYPSEVPAPNFGAGAYGGIDEAVANGGGALRAISDDGSYVFFQTSEPLTPTDVNEDSDVYEWHEGVVTLLSGGLVHSTALYNASTTSFAGASSNGRDVFIYTPEVLMPGADGFGDIYDARLGGGFPEPRPTSCSGDACQGALTNPPQQGAPASLGYQGAGNLTPPVSKHSAKPKALTTAQKLAAALKACRVKKSKSKREACDEQAHRRLGPKNKSQAKKSSARLTMNKGSK